MPKKDLYHNTVVKALAADDWRITDDPLHLSYGGRNLYIDLGADRPIGAEKEGRKIAVEIKSFIGESDIHELGQSIGQYNMYRNLLAEIDPERMLWLAVPSFAYDGIFREEIGQLMISREQIKLIVFDEIHERVREWVPQQLTEK
ncbi:XisH family protein [Candidatus Electrothrix sp.]|uniref:XisH family protein n=1 Tax=Candidatus Electrothrix sp. TaxID=2170559 RepID=UPI0040562B2D